MGWQSYILPFNTDDEQESIMEEIIKHNSGDFEEVGEELTYIEEAEIIKPYQRGPLKNYTKCILCSNGGGRTYTYEYFGKRGILISPYFKAFGKRCKDETGWLTSDVDFPFE